MNLIKKFEEKEIPLFNYGMSLSTSLKELKLQSYDFKNQNEEISIEAKGATVIEKSKAEGKQLELFEKYFMNSYNVDENKLTLMHTAFLSNCLLIHVTEKSAEVKIQRTMNSNASVTHVIVVAEENTRANIIEIQKSSLTKGIKSHCVEVFLKKSAEVNYENLQDLSENIWHFETKRAVCSEESEMNWYTATFGGKLSKVEVSTDLIGVNSKTENLGVFLGRNNQQFDIHNTAIHSNTNTTSNMDNKGIVTNDAKSIYIGLIDIKEKARNSEGYQKQDTIILQNGEANSVPNLEINNNEVSCSHGATVGKISEEKIFYLMSRGLTRKQAETEIVKGFLTAMTTRSKFMKDELHEIIEKRLL